MFEDISKDKLEDALNKSNTWRELYSELGLYDKHGKLTRYLRERFDYLGIDYSRLDNPLNKYIYRKNARNKYTKMLDSEIFVYGNEHSPSTIRRRYLDCGYSEYKCSICGLEPFWNGKPLVLTLDHIDGDTNNNTIENLRWICPNCDRQLPTYAGRNKPKRVVKLPKKLCPVCGKEISRRANLCKDCYEKYRKEKDQYVKGGTQKRPDREKLKDLIRYVPFLQIAKIYGVSDNTIRKWCKKYNLPYRSNEIKKYTDDEWERI